jgi:hypothetical protein
VLEENKIMLVEQRSPLRCIASTTALGARAPWTFVAAFGGPAQENGGAFPSNNRSQSGKAPPGARCRRFLTIANVHKADGRDPPLIKLRPAIGRNEGMRSVQRESACVRAPANAREDHTGKAVVMYGRYAQGARA